MSIFFRQPSSVNPSSSIGQTQITTRSPKTIKMAPKKKTKTGDTLNSRLALVMKSGKVVLGYKSTLKGEFAEYVSVCA